MNRLSPLVNDLLDNSKIESGRMEMEIETVEVDLLIEKALAPFAEQAKEKGIELIPQAPAQLPPVQADPNKIVWVLTNLISNALRYTDPGGHIWVSAEQMGALVRFSVTDDGVGIPLAYQSQIFDKFVQVKSERAAGGSGLGLAISKEMIKAHGGAIWVESEPGQGSTFTVILPLGAGAADGDGPEH